MPKVTEEAKKQGVEIIATITTHHHFDHSGGNKDFASKFPDAPVYGGSDKIPALTNLLKDKNEFSLGENIHIKCLATPCHTQDSICYYVTDKKTSQPGIVFTGDTLFIAGCGRFFEGTGEEMIRALNYLGTLPDQTMVYPGHEYTEGNLSFAKSFDGENKALDRLAELVKADPVTTGRTTIGDEKEWNVFMRLGSDSVRKVTSATTGTSESAIMDALRELKNNFRG